MSGMKIEVDMDWFGHVGKSIPVPVFQCFFLKVKAGIPFFPVWNVGNIFQHDPCGKQQGPRFLRMACSGSAGRNTPSHLARFWHIMWWWHLSNKKGPGLLQFMVKDSHKAGTWDIWPLYLPVSLLVYGCWEQPCLGSPIEMTWNDYELWWMNCGHLVFFMPRDGVTSLKPSSNSEMVCALHFPIQNPNKIRTKRFC